MSESVPKSEPIETVEAALKRARFWIDTLVSYFDIDPADTNVKLSVAGPEGSREITTVNLADDLDAFERLGAAQIISHDAAVDVDESEEP